MGGAVLPSLLQDPLMILLKVKMMKKVIMVMTVMKQVRKAMLLSLLQNPLIIKMMIPIANKNEKIDLWNGEEVEAVGFKARHLNVEIILLKSNQTQTPQSCDKFKCNEMKSKTGTPQCRGAC